MGKVIRREIGTTSRCEVRYRAYEGERVGTIFYFPIGMGPMEQGSYLHNPPENGWKVGYLLV